MIESDIEKMLFTKGITKYKKYSGDRVTEKLVDIDDQRKRVMGPLPQTCLHVRGDKSLVAKRTTLDEIDFECKGVTKPTDEELLQMAKQRGVEFPVVDRTIPVWASDERVDRPGDIVLQNWVLKEYAKNPLLLLSHDWDGMPIGNSLREVVVDDRKDGSYKGRAMHQIMAFPGEDVSVLGDSTFRLMKARLLRTVSVGFYPGEVIYLENEDERAALGLGRWGVIFDKNDLIELSPTSVPANPGARIDAKSMLASGLKASDANVMREYARRGVARGAGDLRVWREIDANLRACWANLFPDAKLRVHEELDNPILEDEIDTDDDTTQMELQKLKDEVARLSSRVEDLQNQIEEETPAGQPEEQEYSDETREALRQALALSDEAVAAAG